MQDKTRRPGYRGQSRNRSSKSRRISWDTAFTRARRVAQPRERGDGRPGASDRIAHALQIDVTDQASIAAAAEARSATSLAASTCWSTTRPISNTGMRPGMSVEEYSQSTRPSNVSLDEVRAVWETNVFGVLAITQAMLPLLREAPAGPASSTCRARRRLADAELGPGLPLPLDLRPPSTPGVQDGS